MIKTKFRFSMDNDLLQDSKSVKAIKKFLKRYRYFEDRAEELYKSSYSGNKIRLAGELFKRYLKESFLIKSTDKKSKGLGIISGSKIVVLLTAFTRTKEEMLISYFKHSRTNYFIHNVKTSFYTNTLKTIGVISFVAFVTNAVILIVMKIKVDLSDWIIRMAFMLLGTAMIFSTANWKDIKDTSIFVKFFAKHKKPQLSP